jgi:hypothetical protein
MTPCEHVNEFLGVVSGTIVYRYPGCSGRRIMATAAVKNDQHSGLVRRSKTVSAAWVDTSPGRGAITLKRSARKGTGRNTQGRKWSSRTGRQLQQQTVDLLLLMGDYLCGADAATLGPCWLNIFLHLRSVLHSSCSYRYETSIVPIAI